MSYSREYENDGSGRDTYINHAGAYWLNPLPAGTFFKSRAADSAPPTVGLGSLGAGDSVQVGKTLYGKSRYGTTVLQANSAGDRSGSGSPDSAAREGRGANGMDATGKGPDFDPTASAVMASLDEVPRPEQRLRQPGHAVSGLEGSDGGSTFTGTGEAYQAPHQVDHTLHRVRRVYESTCHYGLRTGPYYTDDQAPVPTSTLPVKGANWGKSRYY